MFCAACKAAPVGFTAPPDCTCRPPRRQYCTECDLIYLTSSKCWCTEQSLLEQQDPQALRCNWCRRMLHPDRNLLLFPGCLWRCYRCPGVYGHTMAIWCKDCHCDYGEMCFVLKHAHRCY